MAAVNPRTVVVVNSGAPVLLPWTEEVTALLLTWFGGQEFGHALADVLLGDAEPGGRLPTRATTVTAASRCSRSATATATPPGPTTGSRWIASR